MKAATITVNSQNNINYHILFIFRKYLLKVFFIYSSVKQLFVQEYDHSARQGNS